LGRGLGYGRAGCAARSRSGTCVARAGRAQGTVAGGGEEAREWWVPNRVVEALEGVPVGCFVTLMQCESSLGGTRQAQGSKASRHTRVERRPPDATSQGPRTTRVRVFKENQE
jgi:hypothetical protein